MARLVDQFGRPLAPTARPPRGRLLSTVRRTAQYGSTTLTLETIISYLTSAERGMLRYQMEMFARMVERDAHLQGVLQTRRLAITQADWSAMPDDETDTRAVDAAEMIYQELAERDSWEDTVDGLLDAVPQGLAGVEIVWGSDWTIDDLVEVPARLFDWTDPERLRVQVDEDRATFEDLVPHKWIIHTPRLRAGTPLRRGLMRTLSILWCISHYALQDWAGFAEVFGMPVRIGKYDPNSRASDIDALEEALKGIGSDAMGLIPHGMDIEFMQAQGNKTSGNITPMEQIIRYAERKMSICVLGQHLTTEAESGTGTLAGSAHENVRRDIQRADARQLAATLRRDLIRPLVALRLGPDVPLPHMRWDLSDPVDEKARAQVFTIAQDFGWQLSRSQVAEELNLREPADDEDVVQPPQTIDAELSTRLASAPPSQPLSSMQRANRQVAQSAADAQSEALSAVLDLVESLADQPTVETPEHLLTRVRLAAPDLEALLEQAGLTMEELDDAIGRAMITTDYNGRAAVRREADA